MLLRAKALALRRSIVNLFTAILRVTLWSAALAWVATSPVKGQQTEALSLESRIPLPNVTGRIDHLSVDVKGGRLFVAAVDNHTLEVLDLHLGQKIHTIPDLAEPQGVFYDASTNRLFVACALDGVTKIFDGTTLQVLATVKFPNDADNVRYDSRSKNVIVGYAGAKQLRKRETGRGGLGFFDSDGKKISDIVMDAHPESFQLEKTGFRLFVNVPEKKEIEVVDVVKRAVVARWPITEENNFPMSLDETHYRLFVASWQPPQLVVFDTETGKRVASSEISGPSDDLFFDSQRGRIYVLTSQSFLDVFQRKDPDHYERIARYPTPPHTQTGLYVPEWGKLFAAAPRQGELNAEVRVYRAH
jgi:DNA-binding beta-propeller fold protein YncE